MACALVRIATTDSTTTDRSPQSATATTGQDRKRTTAPGSSPPKGGVAGIRQTPELAGPPVFAGWTAGADPRIQWGEGDCHAISCPRPCAGGRVDPGVGAAGVAADERVVRRDADRAA